MVIPAQPCQLPRCLQPHAVSEPGPRVPRPESAHIFSFSMPLDAAGAMRSRARGTIKTTPPPPSTSNTTLIQRIGSLREQHDTVMKEYKGAFWVVADRGAWMR